MNKIEKIEFKKIKRISPSQFYSMKNCAYKSLLAEAFDKKPLLPLSPNAYFGTVLHKMLDLIAKGIIKSEVDFDTEFDKQITSIEEDLIQRGFGFFVPLKFNLKNFGLQKIQLKKHLGKNSEKITSKREIIFHSEKWLESQDKLIGGKVDLVIENGNEIEIFDFKTGAIKQDLLDDEGDVFSDVKNEYKEQLKLYAYLYFESTKKFPTALSIVDLAKQKFPIDFSVQECKSLFNEAKNLLKLTNDSINSNLFSATPNQENCKFCLYRPACSFFNTKLESDFSFNDVIGTVTHVKKFQNGNVTVFLQNGNNQIIIKKISPNEFNNINKNNKQKIRFYNLRKELQEFVYSATNTTRIYM
jgi:CRISPR/Cas system-associated exonuclease Cas4 (RecB family)